MEANAESILGLLRFVGVTLPSRFLVWTAGHFSKMRLGMGLTAMGFSARGSGAI